MSDAVSETTRVVIADDNLLIRQGLASLLELSDAIEIVGLACDPTELQDQLEVAQPDVVITDIRMPPTHTNEGIDAALKIRNELPDVGVVVLSQFSEPEYVLKLFQHGSNGLGYMLKERIGDLDQLEQAIQSVRAGGSAVDPKIIDILVRGESAAGPRSLDVLTPREAEVLGLIAEGLNNATIGERLGLSTKAVSNHINNIFSKLDLGHDPESDRRVRAVLMWLADH